MVPSFNQVRAPWSASYWIISVFVEIWLARVFGKAMSDSNEILKIIARRTIDAEGALKPRDFSDGKRIALALEGGGMRGVIEAATAAAFESMARLVELIVENGGDCRAARAALEAEQSEYAKLREHPKSGVLWADKMFCVSVGAPVGLFSAAKQARERTPIFFEEMATREFVDLKLLFGIVKREITDRGHNKDFRPPMNLGVMLKAMKHPEQGLDVAQVLNSGIPIRFAVTELDASPIRNTWIDPLIRQGSTVFEITKAACLIPGIAGAPEQGEPRHFDTMISPVAMLPANENFDYVIVFGSHPVGDRAKRKLFNIFSSVMTWASRAAMKDGNEAAKYVEFITEQKRRSAEIVKESKRQTDRFVYFGTPEGTPEVTNATIDPLKLKNQAALAYKSTMERLRDPYLDVLTEKKGVRLTNVDDLKEIKTPAFWNISEQSKEPSRHPILQIKKTRKLQM
jgi:hypothetical protein